MSKARDIASAPIAPSTVSATELGYVDGVTSAIQTQINTKASTSYVDTAVAAVDLTNVTRIVPVDSNISVPGAPTSVSGTVGSASSSVSFVAPTDNGGSTILSYTVISSPGNIKKSGTSSPIMITGLTNDTAYTFTVKAHSIAGSSVASTASSSVTPISAFSVDYLVVAGGAGGGGGSDGGGGGAGGLRSTVTATGGGGSLETALSIAPNTNYTVTVGGGGSGGFTSNRGGAGSNSVFSTITSTGGGGGGSDSSSQGVGNGGDGGSGGGGSNNLLGGAGTANQGRSGGRANLDGTGGGGGANNDGSAGTGGTAQGGNGGDGVATSITGTSVTYAGGGGGGGRGGSNSSGGAGGGGGGKNNSTDGTAGTANTGGGGGGCGFSGTPRTGGVGGSGVVILRYPDSRTITIGAGLTGTESSASGGYKRATLTAGTGNVSWA
jgi:hypothetical protein